MSSVFPTGILTETTEEGPGLPPPAFAGGFPPF